MLTLQSFPKVLVEYKRKPSHLKSFVAIEDGVPTAKLQLIKGATRGIMVSIGPNIIGWALCDKKDTFNLAYGIDLALRRANIAKNLSYRNRNSFYATVPDSMREMFVRMDDRSERYFPIVDEA